jgi:hypothetical protein
MVPEILEQLTNLPPPTHVLLQGGGVGGLAAAVAGVLADVFGANGHASSSSNRLPPRVSWKVRGTASKDGEIW